VWSEQIAASPSVMAARSAARSRAERSGGSKRELLSK
jgi:hypothetical protein